MKLASKKKIMLLAAGGAFAVVAVLGIRWKELTTYYYIYRLRNEPALHKACCGQCSPWALLRAFLEKPDWSCERKAATLFVQSEEGAKDLLYSSFCSRFRALL